MSEGNAIISGASRGIGLELARAAADSFDRLGLVASSQSSFESIRKDFSPDTRYYWGDFSKINDVSSIASRILTDFDSMSLLVNNCGAYLEKPFSESNLEEINRILDINWRASVNFTRVLIPLLERGDNSIIVNISSTSARSHPANQAIYSASKAALTAFSDSLRKELNPKGIRVTVIQPSGVNTWDDPNPQSLLRTQDLGQLLRAIVSADSNCQFEEITISALGA